MSTAKRAGSRRGPRQRPRPRLVPALYAAGATMAVIGWGYLVWMAVDFGQSARGGDTARWTLLAVAAIGAMACLFTAIMLIARLLRHVSTPAALPTQNPDRTATDAEPPIHPGGRRRA